MKERGLFYKPSGAYCGDVIPFYENGLFYLFYIHDYRDPEHYGEECPWALVTTRDFVDFKEYGEVIPRGGGQEQDKGCCTGSIVRVGDTYYAFYAGCNWSYKQQGKPPQQGLLATSKDLIHWEKRRDFLLTPAIFMETDDLRDPFVFFDERMQEYRMLITGRIKGKGPAGTRGAIIAAHTVNRNMFGWEYEEKPFYMSDGDYACECPDLFRMGGKWYLIYSCFTGGVHTCYRMADSIDGPWKVPENEAFDGFGSYAAKTVSDGARRFLIGWNSTFADDSDSSKRLWGGTIVPRELFQNPDGTLAVSCVPEIHRQYSRPVALEVSERLNASETATGGLVLGENGNQGLALYKGLPEFCRLECDLLFSDDCGKAGFLLYTDRDMTTGFGIVFEPKFRRLAMVRRPLWYNFFNQKNVEAEVLCPVKANEPVHVCFLLCGTLVEVYVDGRVVMGGRVNGPLEGLFGLFSTYTRTTFEQLEVFTEK